MEEIKTKIDIYFCDLVGDLDNFKPIDNSSIFNNIKKEIKKSDPIKGHFVEISNVKDAKLIIAFTRMENLHDNKTYLNLTNKLRKISEYKTKKIENYDPLPIVVIGLEDITKENNPILNSLNLDQRVKFFDSCIWHRYVPLNKDFNENFKNVINDIIKYKELKLYETSVAREFLEFKTRMMVNSYLAPVGKSGHALHLVPYKFHSESLMKLQFEKEKGKKEIKDKLKNLHWKFLLIDDYAMKHLRTSDDSNNDNTQKKSDIIKSSLEGILDSNKVDIIEWTENWNSDNGNKSILLCVESIEIAKDAMKAEMFDIIFLDYLFTEEGKLGSELLKEIQKKENDDLRKNIGPLNKFWFFPVSAFSYAMMDELRESGLGYEEDHWHISSGSDPINTPWLFKYKLIKFIKLQIELLNKNIPSFFNEFHSHRINIQESAQNSYATLIALRKDYYSLKNDNQKKSIFAKSMLEYFEKNNAPNHIWEHLNHLIYLLAFGSGTEWAEMWEEYVFIKNYIDCLRNTSDSDRCLRNIKKYIIDFQKEYSR